MILMFLARASQIGNQLNLYNNMLHKITQIISVQPFQVVCKFNTNEIRKIDLMEWVREFKAGNNGWTSKLADPAYFNTVKLDSYGTLSWDNQVDFDPDVLYQMSLPLNEKQPAT